MNLKTKIIIGVGLGIVGIGAIILFFVAQNKSYNVTFDTDGGSYAMPQVVKNGNFIVRPADPTREGYRFVRWELNGMEFDFTTPVEGDIALKAIWEKIEIEVVKHKIIFSVDGTTKELEVSDVNEINLDNLGFEEKDGYDIVWYVNGEVYDLTTPITEDMTIEGKYVKVDTFTVKFDSVGGDKVNSQKIIKGEKAKEPAAIKKRGYIFEGWYLNDKKYDFNNEVTGNITLKAKWKEDPAVKRYTVKFDTDKGSSIPNQRVMENDKVTKPANPTRVGYKFVTWKLGENEYIFSSPVTSDITIKAIWRELVKYNVTFDTDGGSSVLTQAVTEGETAKEPTKPTKDGYIFKYWTLDGKNAYTFKEKVNQSITLKAVWEVKPVVVEYTVTFDSTGGTSVPSQTVTKGGTVREPAKPTKQGHTFKEWTLNGSPYTFGSPVNSNITLVATWTPNQVQDRYTVSVSLAGSFSTDSVLKVKKNGSVITVKEIKYSDGRQIHGALYKGSEIYIATSDVEGVTSFIVILSDNSQVTASRE